jgi:hypothetical protein
LASRSTTILFAQVIDKAYADDPALAAAEYGAEFRSDSRYGYAHLKMVLMSIAETANNRRELVASTI